MYTLNYSHLYYFWRIAKLGTVTEAAATLRLSQPTLSAQLKSLEDGLGVKLFTRVGRSLVLSDHGKITLEYAETIFTVGEKLLDRISGSQAGYRQKLEIGIADVVPKLLSFRLLEPLFEESRNLIVNCHERRPVELLADLAVGKLDAVISDSPIPHGLKVKGYSRLLGSSTISFFASKTSASKLKRGFPQSLNRSKMLLPTEPSIQRQVVDAWLQKNGLHPQMAGEFEDSALMKIFGQYGTAVFPVPSVIRKEVERQYSARCIGEVEELREDYYLISTSKRIEDKNLLDVIAGAQSVFAM